MIANCQRQARDASEGRWTVSCGSPQLRHPSFAALRGRAPTTRRLTMACSPLRTSVRLRRRQTKSSNRTRRSTTRAERPSVYCWELDETSFAACVLLKKDVDVKKRGLESGGWDAIHVIEVRPAGSGQAHYKLTSTVMLRLATDHSTGAHSSGELKLSGSMTRQQEATCPVVSPQPPAHLPNMGRLIEDMENRMRDSLQAVYFGKTKSTISELYKPSGVAQEAQKSALASELMGLVGKRG